MTRHSPSRWLTPIVPEAAFLPAPKTQYPRSESSPLYPLREKPDVSGFVRSACCLAVVCRGGADSDLYQSTIYGKGQLH